MGLLVAPQSAG